MYVIHFIEYVHINLNKVKNMLVKNKMHLYKF